MRCDGMVWQQRTANLYRNLATGLWVSIAAVKVIFIFWEYDKSISERYISITFIFQHLLKQA